LKRRQGEVLGEAGLADAALAAEEDALAVLEEAELEQILVEPAAWINKPKSEDGSVIARA
jgi:hypothetical protein